MLKYNYSTLLLVIILFSCTTPKPAREFVLKNHPSLSENELVGIVQSKTKVPLDSTDFIGRIYNGQSKKSQHIFGISFPQIMQNYIVKARKIGANLIKINQTRYAQSKKQNDEIDASFYKVDDIRNYETKIYWSADRELTWADFKGSIPDAVSNENYSSYASVGIQHRSDMEGLLGKQTFFVLASFDCMKSWYRPYAYFQDNYLSFQQGLFDLTELYSRKMYARFSDKKFKGNKTAYISAVDDSLGVAYKKAERDYVADTNAGADTDALNKWRAKLKLELKSN